MKVTGNKKKNELGLQMKAGKTRELSLDFLRGLAVIFMIITHVNAVFYTGKTVWLDTFTWWGATACFTIFLFCSGAVYGGKLFEGSLDWRRMLKRAAGLLGVYFLAALGVRLLGGAWKGWASVRDLVLLNDIPEFTEFILAFVLYAVVVALFGGVLRKALKYKWAVLVGGLAIFALANYLYGLNWGGGVLNIIKGLLVGNGEWHRFGVLSYMPVFALGLVWGWGQKESGRFRWDLALVGVVASGVIMALFWFTGWSKYDRWPPSLFFMFYGLVFCFGALGTWPVVQRLKLVVGAVNFLGTRALDYFWIHVWVLMLGFMAFGSAGRQEGFVVIALGAVFAVAMLVVVLKERLVTGISGFRRR